MGKIKEKLKRIFCDFVMNVLIEQGIILQIENIKEEINGITNRLDGITNRVEHTSKDVEEISLNIRNINAVIPAKTDLLSEDLVRLGNNIRNINAIIPAKTDALSEEFEKLAVNVRNNNAQLEQIGYLETKLNSLERRLQKNASLVSDLETKEKKSLGYDSVTKQTGAEMSMPYTVVDYFDFENHFRGTREQIKEIQKQYLLYFKGCKRVLDLGCGRGEFLELLQQEGIEVLGVDIYEDYVEYCKSKGMKAIQDDAVHYLQNNDKMVDGIFVAQVVEHLELEEMVEVCNLVYDRLDSGGCAIFETPNPTSLAIYTHAFYMDPSHTKPVHPLTLKYFLEKAGFQSIEIIYTENSKLDLKIPPIKTEQNEEEFNLAMQEVQKLLFGSQDYAIIARKQ